MKILFVFSISAGGMETLNFERNLALSRRGLKCHFLYLQKRKNTVLTENTAIYMTNKEDEIKGILQEHQYQAVIVCTAYEFLEKLKKLGYTGKVVYEVQGLGNYENTARWLERSKAFVMSYADAILYPKTLFLDELMKKYFPSKKLFSFHNCINPNSFAYVEVPKINHTIIGWVGRLDENKNWKEFLTFGASIRKAIPNVKLWLFHDPSVCPKRERNIFFKWVKKLDLTEALVIHENVTRDKMPQYFSMIANSGGFVCSTSKLEGFGYSVIEAMCCQCPVLTTRSGGVESFVIHNVTGKFYQQGNIMECVSEAKELLTNLELRNKMVSNANSLIHTSFSPEQYGEHFIEMLVNLNLHKN